MKQKQKKTGNKLKRNRQRHGNPASAIAGAVCAAAGLGALVGINLLLRKQRKVQDKKEHARKEE